PVLVSLRHRNLLGKLLGWAYVGGGHVLSSPPSSSPSSPSSPRVRHRESRAPWNRNYAETFIGSERACAGEREGVGAGGGEGEIVGGRARCAERGSALDGT